METILTMVIPELLKSATGVETVIICCIILVGYVTYLLLKKKLPFIFTTRKTLNFIGNSIKATDKDIQEINAIYALQLDGIVVSHLKDITDELQNFWISKIDLSDPSFKQRKIDNIDNLIVIITYELRDAIRQSIRENGFIDKDDLLSYTKSIEFHLYDIIKKNCKSRYYFNNIDDLFSIINTEDISVSKFKDRLSKLYFELFSEVKTHLLKCRAKTNELMNHNESTIKDLI